MYVVFLRTGHWDSLYLGSCGYFFYLSVLSSLLVLLVVLIVHLRIRINIISVVPLSLFLSLKIACGGKPSSFLLLICSTVSSVPLSVFFSNSHWWC